MRMIYTRNDTHNKIFGFAVSHVNSNLNAINYSQKLKKIMKSIKVKFSRPLNNDKTEEFNQISTKFNFIRPKLFKNKITPFSAS